MPSGDSGRKSSARKSSALPDDCSVLSSRIEELTAEFEGLASSSAEIDAPEPLTTVHQQPRPCPWKTIYRIAGRAYLGPPQWQHTDAGIGLVGSMPIRDVAQYLDRHPEIQFVVFREYVPERVPEELDLDEYSLPEPHAQALWFSSPAALEAVTRLAQTYPELEPSLSSVNLQEEICEPYVILFHMFDKWETNLRQLAMSDQEMLESILECIRGLIGPRYERAIDAISRGKISREDLIFLPKPGDILVQSAPALGTFMVSSWAAPGGVEKNHCSDAALCDTASAKWHISGWSWTMSGGSLCKASRTEKYGIGAGTDGEVNIDTLEVYPLRHANTEVREYLRKRGQSFWRYYHESAWVAYPRQDSVPDEPEAVHAPVAGLARKPKSLTPLQARDRIMMDISGYRKAHPSEKKDTSIEGEDAERDTELMDGETAPGDDTITLFPATLPGYNLRRKEWGGFGPLGGTAAEADGSVAVHVDVDRIEPLGPGSRANSGSGCGPIKKRGFEKLILDEETKTLLRSLVTNHITETRPPAPTAAGEGHGLAILLHG